MHWTTFLGQCVYPENACVQGTPKKVRDYMGEMYKYGEYV